VALLWGDTVIQERILYEPQTFRIGEDLRNDFIIPSEKLDQKFPLFRAGRDGQYDIGLSRELTGNVTINKETQSIDEFVKTSTDNATGVNFRSISPGDWGIVELDDLAVYFQFVQQESRVPRKGFLAFDEVTVAAIAMSFLLQVGFLAYSVVAWQETAIRIVRNNEVKIPKVEAIVIDPEEPEELDGEEDDTTAKRAEDEEGKFGDPEEDPLKETKVPKNEAKMVDKIDPKKVGLNDLLSTDKLGGEGAIANILNSNTSGFSNKIAVAMAGEGSEFVLGHGSGGLDSRAPARAVVATAATVVSTAWERSTRVAAWGSERASARRAPDGSAN
jgi:hypothetical protein